jgi:protein-tyrosine phosphatase
MVCTGNICRSPMAAALLAAELRDRAVHATVHSAGTMAWRGPATDLAVVAMRERGIDLSAHRARPLTAALVEQADLVVGMTRDHIGRVQALVPDARDRTFLPAELGRLGRSVGARAADESVRTWAARVARTRPGDVPGRGGDEIADPLGEPLAVYRVTAARLHTDLVPVAELLAG